MLVRNELSVNIRCHASTMYYKVSIRIREPYEIKFEFLNEYISSNLVLNNANS